MLVMSHFLPEKGEVVSPHYKLVPADLRDVQQLNDIISVAGMDPRYVWVLSSVSAFLFVCLSFSCTLVIFCYYSNIIDNLLEDMIIFYDNNKKLLRIWKF